MKTITKTQAFAELACARDSLGEVSNNLYDFSHKAHEDSTTEGRVIAAEVRRLLKEIYTIQMQFAALANCYL